MDDRPITQRRRTSSVRILTLWVLLGALILACFLLSVTLGIFWYGSGRNADKPPSTAILVIIPAASATATVPINDGQLPPDGEQTPSSPSGGEIVMDAYVQVFGTGGDGLRMRDNPGLEGKVLLVAAESEVFKVVEGPVEMDGYRWWRLEGPFDATRQGWVVGNYLEIVQNP